jgi:hypothetical protein
MQRFSFFFLLSSHDWSTGLRARITWPGTSVVGGVVFSTRQALTFMMCINGTKNPTQAVSKPRIYT